MWTDGSFKRRRRHTPDKGGWGFILLGRGIAAPSVQELEAKTHLLMEGFGPVTLDLPPPVGLARGGYFDHEWYGGIAGSMRRPFLAASSGEGGEVN